MGHKSGTFVKILHQFKRKNKSHLCCEMLVEAMLMAAVRLHVAVELWMRSCFLKHAK